jgi:LemA protein
MYNTAITNFPGNLVASMFGYVEEKYIDEENYEENKKIDKSEVNFDQF